MYFGSKLFFVCLFVFFANAGSLSLHVEEKAKEEDADFMSDERDYGGHNTHPVPKKRSKSSSKGEAYSKDQNDVKHDSGHVESNNFAPQTPMTKKVSISAATNNVHSRFSKRIHRFFNTNEHVTLGPEPADDDPVGIDDDQLLTLPNGIQLTFGHIVSLAGDFYGVPGSPIVNTRLQGGSEGGSDEADADGRKDRFMTAYNTLAEAPREKVMKILKKLLTMMEEEGNCTADEEHLHSNKEWDEATGGNWLGGIPIFPGKMLELAEYNYDHFQPQAKQAYMAGHELAIEKARQAGRKKDVDDQRKILMVAYSLDAFACHYLTDSFASGHIRTPRVELKRRVTPSKVGDLLSKFMHDEDNKYGLRVTNVRGDKWIAFGDGVLCMNQSEENYRLVKEAVQRSVAQVREAFKDTEAKLNSSFVTDLIPFVDSTAKNNSPLFQLKDDKLHRRSDINNLQGKKTTTNWWGTSTAATLESAKKKNSAISIN